MGKTIQHLPADRTSVPFPCRRVRRASQSYSLSGPESPVFFLVVALKGSNLVKKGVDDVSTLLLTAMAADTLPFAMGRFDGNTFTVDGACPTAPPRLRLERPVKHGRGSYGSVFAGAAHPGPPREGAPVVARPSGGGGGSGHGGSHAGAVTARVAIKVLNQLRLAKYSRRQIADGRVVQTRRAKLAGRNTEPPGTETADADCDPCTSGWDVGDTFVWLSVPALDVSQDAEVALCVRPSSGGPCRQLVLVELLRLFGAPYVGTGLGAADAFAHADEMNVLYCIHENANENANENAQNQAQDPQAQAHGDTCDPNNHHEYLSLVPTNYADFLLQRSKRLREARFQHDFGVIRGQSARVLPVHGVFEDWQSDSFSLRTVYEMPLHAFGDMFTLVSNRAHKLPVQDVLSTARQLGRALVQLHASGVAHLDIKLENVLVTKRGFDAIWSEPKPDEVCLADLGLARGVGDGLAWGSLTRDRVGTPSMWAPEVWRTRETSRLPYDACLQDAWAFGVSVWMMLEGSPPFHFRPWECARLARWRQDCQDRGPGGEPPEWLFPSAWPAGLRRMLAGLMHYSPQGRQRVVDLEWEHPWLAETAADPAAAPTTVPTTAASAAHQPERKHEYDHGADADMF